MPIGFGNILKGKVAICISGYHAKGGYSVKVSSKFQTTMATVGELCSEANEQYVNENYQKAVELYTEALTIDDRRDDIYCHRAQAFLQMSKLAEAAQDYDKALQLNDNNNKAYVKKGSTLFQMNEVEKALEVFEEGHKRFESDTILEDWIHKCQVELSKLSSADKCPGEKEKLTQPTESVLPAEPPKLKYNWYQTHTHVVVVLMVKGVKDEDLAVDAYQRALKISIKGSGDSPLSLDVALAHQVDPQQVTTKIFSTKVEIKLKKREGIQWANLEGASDPEPIEVLPLAAANGDRGLSETITINGQVFDTFTQFRYLGSVFGDEGTKVELRTRTAQTRATPVKQEPPRYPSSSHHTRDWDKIAAEVTEEEKNEKLEGDAALNQFFQKIYADASDDTKKAMMKSFTESGGTVLSTNWDEVGSKRVEVKPPDGMEFKKWEA